MWRQWIVRVRLCAGVLGDKTERHLRNRLIVMVDVDGAASTFGAKF